MHAYLAAMGRYGVLRGRTSRGDYWRFVLVYVALAFGAALLDQALGTAWKDGGLCIALVYLVHVIPQVAALVRRLHDTDHSGWWCLIAFTGIGVLALLVLACLRGTPTANRFGPAPVEAGFERSPIAPVASPPIVSNALSRRDAIAEIERLALLRKDGHLSEAEFEVMKAEALAQVRTA